MRYGPLSGFVIGVTADRRAREQIDLLVGRGAVCVHAPAIATNATGETESFLEANDEVLAGPVDIVVIMTAIGLRAWLEAAHVVSLGEQLRNVLEGSHIYARGSKAAGAAMSEGLEVAWTAPTAIAGEIVDELAGTDLTGKRIVVQLDGSQDEWLADALRSAGASVVTVPSYRWTLPTDLDPVHQLVRAVSERKVDAVTFTARPAVENLMAIAEQAALADPVRAAFDDGVLAMCVGPVTAEGAARNGIRSASWPARYRLGSMVHLLTTYFADRASDVVLAGRQVVTQGRMVAVDGCEPVMLSERERDVLQVLSARPGVVHSKESLLRSVWAGSGTDTHTVEVTVGRLRRRLGEAGPGIETVFRRGYRLRAHTSHNLPEVS